MKHIEIMKDLQEMGIDGKDIRVLKNLYWEQMAAISIDGEISEWTYIKIGVRQGCVISPDLFSLYAEIIMRKVKQRSDHLKFTINGVNIQNIRYADDTVLLARSKVDLEKLLHVLKEESEIRGLNINRKKTKIMVFSKSKISPKCRITLDDEELQQVESFNYLGSVLTQDCRCTSDIKTRIALAKKSFTDMSSTFTNKHLENDTKKEIDEVLYLVRPNIWMRIMDLRQTR